MNLRERKKERWAGAQGPWIPKAPAVEPELQLMRKVSFRILRPEASLELGVGRTGLPRTWVAGRQAAKEPYRMATDWSPHTCLCPVVGGARFICLILV